MTTSQGLRWEGKERSMSSSLLLQLCLNVSSERRKKKRDELLPLLVLRTKKPGTSFAAEKKKNEKEAKKGGGEFLQVARLHRRSDPNPLWEEMKAAGKPTVVFDRKLTDSDVRRDLTRCILNRQEMLEVLVPALTEEETGEVYNKVKKLRVVVVAVAEGRWQKNRNEMNVVWWPSLKQFVLVNGWTEFVHNNRLLKDELIQLSYFRFSDDQQSHHQQQQQQLGLLIHCRPEFLMADHQPQPQPQPQSQSRTQPNQDQEKLSAKTREGRETSMSSSLLLQLCLNISSERWKRERDELLPLLPLRTKKPRTSFVAEKKKKEKKEKAAKKGGGGGFLQVAPPPPPQRLFLDLNEEPNPLWEEMKAAGKPTVVFNRMLTDSDVRRDLARCILNRQEMLEVFLPALTEDEAGKVTEDEAGKV
ncbi:hypothetical protein ACLOJK_035133 [Asimina triloba]